MTKNEPLSAAGRIYLVGLRGSGKSTVARILARRLGWSMADADDAIETLTGCSIVELLQSAGLAVLRDREAEVLRIVAALDRHVIATAGGCVVRSENRELLRTTGAVIWLTAKPETLWLRMQHDPLSETRRPALTELDPRAEIDWLAREREPWYREVAQLSVETDDRSPDQVVDTILSAWPS